MDKIYKLIDPETMEVRYIGKTCRSLSHRLYYHIKEAKKGVKTYKCNWIRSLINKGKIPIIKLVKIVTSGYWQHWEKLYITKYKKLGHRLSNATEGGEGVTMTPETIEKIRQGNLGKKRSPETKLRLSISHTKKDKKITIKKARVRIEIDYSKWLTEDLTNEAINIIFKTNHNA